MRLVILISPKNKVTRLLNIDSQNTNASSDRDLDTWKVPTGTNLRWTCWKNHNKSSLNPYDFNRVNVHYTSTKNFNVTKSYYCIHKVIEIDNMTFNDFDTNNIFFD